MSAVAIAGGRAASGDRPVHTLATARPRLVLCLIVFIAAVGLLTVRLADLAIFGTGAKPGPATVAMPRADLVDRRGVLLAHRFEAYAVVARPHQLVERPATLAPRLAAAIGGDAAQVEAALGWRGKFRYVARRVRPEVARRVQALGDPGLELQREPDRFYPNIDLGAHIIGYTGIDGHGDAGMERALDARLGTPGGGPVALSIDARVQQALESELGAGMAKHSAIGAAGVVMDVATGEIVAMASLPQYNPNAAGRAPADARFNRATLGVYELGSTFKAVTVAMALDSGVTTMADMYDARFPLKVDRFRIHDDHPKARFLSVPEVFIYSSNIGTARMAERIGAARQQAYLRQLGFLDPLSIELPEKGRTLYPANWGSLATMTVGYGHGIAVTPVHLATAYAALVNGGIWRPATLLRVAPGSAATGERVFTAATSDAMRRLMRLVVLKGTGRKADAPGYRVGGKTGTAEKPQAGRYNRGALVSTFAGAFPMDAPRYVVIAMLDEPRGTKDTFGFKTGGWVSAPIVRRVVERIGPMLGVSPDMGRDEDVAGLLPGDAKAED